MPKATMPSIHAHGLSVQAPYANARASTPWTIATMPKDAHSRREPRPERARRRRRCPVRQSPARRPSTPPIAARTARIVTPCGRARPTSVAIPILPSPSPTPSAGARRHSTPRRGGKTVESQPIAEGRRSKLTGRRGPPRLPTPAPWRWMSFTGGMLHEEHDAAQLRCWSRPMALPVAGDLCPPRGN